MSKHKIEIDDHIFDGLKDQLNRHIKTVLNKTYDGQFESGTITVKIGIGVQDETEQFLKGDGDYIPYDYKKPTIVFDITSQLKKGYKSSANVSTADLDIRKLDDIFVLESIKKAQMSIFE